MLKYSKTLALVAIIKMVLLIMLLFNLKIGQDVINEPNNVPTSKRELYHEMTVRLYYFIEINYKM